MRDRVIRGINGFDAHMHLNDAAFADGLGGRLERLAEAGYEGAVSGWDIPSSRAAMEIARKQPFLCATAGIHPCYIPEDLNEALSVLTNLAGSGAAAIGECGFDEKAAASLHRQREVFEAQLDLAVSLSLPVVLHVRGRHGALLEVLRSWRGCVPMLLHGASLSKELLKAYLDLGCMISIGALAVRENAIRTRETAKWVPSDCLLIETDCPFQPPALGIRNEPEFLSAVASAVSECRGSDVDNVLMITRENARRFYGKPAEERK